MSSVGQYWILMCRAVFCRAATMSSVYIVKLDLDVSTLGVTEPCLESTKPAGCQIGSR